MGDSGSGFDRGFAQAFVDKGWRTEASPGEVSERWQRFAADCLAGYPWDLEDYLNDLTMRTLVSEVLPQLTGSAADAFRAGIERTDLDVRKVLDRDSFPSFPSDQWWLRSSPSYAARSFCAEFESAYGVHVRAQSRFDDDVAELSGLVAGGLTPAEACLRLRASNHYVAATDSLFLRAAREALGLDRKASRALWSWLTGRTTDTDLRAALDQA
ncbi:hypothetical protein [Streptacidiphilus albus]|uniref:hypothetical protein n=1 Tax=Streptacidiphilus albus TaxID=105425 RepID=UPI00054BD23A|nr:hypothetical protein [Streptacidiphilus albus]